MTNRDEAIERAAREIAEDIDFGNLEPSEICNMLSKEERKGLFRDEQLALAQKKRFDAHVESISAILRKHFSPAPAGEGEAVKQRRVD